MIVIQEGHMNCVMVMMSVQLMACICGQKLNKNKSCHLTIKEAQEGLRNSGLGSLMNLVVGLEDLELLTDAQNVTKWVTIRGAVKVEFRTPKLQRGR